MLKSVEELAPELFPFVYFVYGEPSTLFWGNKLLQSFKVVQQGPLGPLLFRLTIHRLSMHLKSEFVHSIWTMRRLGVAWEMSLRILGLLSRCQTIWSFS